MDRHISPTEFPATAPIGRGRPESLSGPELAILSLADPSPDSRVVLFVPGALELTCALLRRGISEVTIARVEDRVRAADADIVIIPEASSVMFLERAIHCARRVLAPLGTIAIRLLPGLIVPARHHLLLHGFGALRERVVFGDTLIRAELPLYGKLACA